MRCRGAAACPTTSSRRRRVAPSAGSPGRSERVTLGDDARLLHVMCGFDVEPQVVLRDRDGDVIGRADLWLVGTRRVHEYDGATHRDPVEHGRDLARDRRFARAEYQRFGYTAR